MGKTHVIDKLFVQDEKLSSENSKEKRDYSSNTKVIKQKNTTESIKLSKVNEINKKMINNSNQDNEILNNQKKLNEYENDKLNKKIDLNVDNFKEYSLYSHKPDENNVYSSTMSKITKNDSAIKHLKKNAKEVKKYEYEIQNSNPYGEEENGIQEKSKNIYTGVLSKQAKRPNEIANFELLPKKEARDSKNIKIKRNEEINFKENSKQL